MTELARIEPANNTLAHRAPNLPQPAAGVTALQVWVETAQAAGQLVASIVDTPFFPAALWPRQTSTDPEQEEKRRAQAIANGTGALIYGAELGLTPMNSLTQVFVVHGRPSIYANTMVALVQAAGHEIWTVESTETRAVVCGRRAGSDKIETGEMTIERAKKAGWVAKNQNYVTNPVAMLYARAASIACNRTAPEVLKGIPSFEEVTDDPRVQRAAAPPVAGVPVSVAEITGAAPEPAADEPESSEPAQSTAQRPLAERVAVLADWFAGKWGVPTDALVARVGRPVDDWLEDDLTALRHVGAALGKGQTTVAEAFPPGAAAEPPADEPADGELVDDPPPAQPALGGMSNTQRSRLFGMLGQLGVVDRDARLRMAARLLNMDAPLGSFNDLTAEQADEVAVELAQLVDLPEVEGREQAAILADQEDGR